MPSVTVTDSWEWANKLIRCGVLLRNCVGIRLAKSWKIWEYCKGPADLYNCSTHCFIVLTPMFCRTLNQACCQWSRYYQFSGNFRICELLVLFFGSLKWVELKMGQLGVLSNPNYKITALLDHLAMITVQSDYRGTFDCKPLGLIWAQFPEVCRWFQFKSKSFF